MTARNSRFFLIAAIAAFALAGTVWAEAPASAPSAPASAPSAAPAKTAPSANTSTTPSPRALEAIAKGQAASGVVSPADLLDINSATKEQLAKLPGIGDARAAKIIAGRPYRMKTELIQKHIIPMADYQKIAGMIIAKQPPAPAAAAPAASGSTAPGSAAPAPAPSKAAPAAPPAPKP